ncbi:MAG: 16S rRNA (guanine(527)-N(7))-methyltransferase RsmG, partial [Candidatus Obscuribacterales bacterium]|nr:16S rRNA (guanine(527)-N(7))-methyltransferase RsmG [Candidatus Obscuribacterales bacterium]
FTLSEQQLEAFRTYADFIGEYGEHTNLVADTSAGEIFQRHIADSLSILEFKKLHRPASVSDKKAARLIDLGSGAGFPGLCLAIAICDLKVVLVESVGKKARFLREAIERLDLSDRVELFEGRAENLTRHITGTGMKGGFDIATSRALGHLALLAELAMPLLKQGGLSLNYKSESQARSELKESAKLLKLLGCDHATIFTPFIQTSSSRHVLIALSKIKGTPSRYPRPWATMKKEVAGFSFKQDMKTEI